MQSSQQISGHAQAHHVPGIEPALKLAVVSPIVRMSHTRQTRPIAKVRSYLHRVGVNSRQPALATKQLDCGMKLLGLNVLRWPLE